MYRFVTLYTDLNIPHVGWLPRLNPSASCGVEVLGKEVLIQL